MERTPIFAQSEEVAAIRLIETPLTISKMLPDYYYQLQSGNISDEASEMYDELVKFLHTNEELATSVQVSSKEDYIKGFQKAMALTRLWIDSIYLQKPEK